MKIELDVTKNANENAQALFNKSKEAKAKKDNLVVEIDKTKKTIDSEKNRQKFMTKEDKETEKKKVRILEQREWFAKFHHFITSEGKIVIGGHDAQQNDLLFSKHFESNDLFFHADVHGASAVVIRNGKAANEQSLKETAQFAASYSSAWKGGIIVVDVFYADHEHVSKYSQGEYVPKGGFMIKGEKKWFKNTELRLVIAIERINNVEKIVVVPGNYDFLHSPRAFIRRLVVQPGDIEKKEIAKSVVNKLQADSIDLAYEQILQILPGNSQIV